MRAPVNAIARDNKLVAVATSHADAALEQAAVKDALRAAELLGAIEVRSDADATILSDQRALIKRGLNEMEQHIRPLKDVLDAAKRVLLGRLQRARHDLEAAYAVAGQKLLAWQAREARRIEDERLAREQEAARAAAAAAAAGQQPAPAADEAPAEPQRVRGGGSVTYQTRTLKIEVVNPAACDPSWLTITPAARRAVTDARAIGAVLVPDGREHAVTWRGLRVWNEVGVATKS